MIIIGVTGGMGGGKSTVAKFLEEFGAGIIEADKVAKGLYATIPELKSKIIETYGRNVLDDSGNVAFKKLAEKAFKDSESAKLINQITHPFVRDEIRKLIMVMAISKRAVAVDAALLLEGELVYVVDYIITVTAPADLRIKRIVDSGRFTKDEVVARINFQMDEDEKVKRADYVIHNTGTLDELKAKSKEIFDGLFD